VPYRGQGPAANDLLGGQLQLMFPSVPDTLAFLVSGKLRALAIMGDRRLKLLPNVPTTVELGWPKLISSFWAGLYATAGTPQPVLDRLNRELVQIVTSPGFAGRVEPLGFEARDDARRIRPIQCGRDQTLGSDRTRARHSAQSVTLSLPVLNSPILAACR
jgi:tripartite-type tricarboxylate transporter receptor subunit TctC